MTDLHIQQNIQAYPDAFPPKGWAPCCSQHVFVLLSTLNFAPLSCTLKNQSKTYRDQSYPKAFKQTWVKLSVLSRSSLQTIGNASTHTLFLSLGLEPTSIVGHSVQILFKGHKNQGVVFVQTAKLDSSLDEIPKSDPLRIKSFHSFLKQLKCFQAVRIKFGFLQKHHNSQLQSITSATAVSVVLVDHHNARWAWKSVINLSFTDDNRSNLNYAVWYIQP